MGQRSEDLLITAKDQEKKSRILVVHAIEFTCALKYIIEIMSKITLGGNLINLVVINLLQFQKTRQMVMKNL